MDAWSQKMPGSGGEEFLWKIRQITDAKICQKINGHSQARPQDATVGEVKEYGEERTGRCPRYRPSWKWLPEPEPWSWAIWDTGIMLCLHTFLLITAVLWSFAIQYIGRRCCLCFSWLIPTFTILNYFQILLHRKFCFFVDRGSVCHENLHGWHARIDLDPKKDNGRAYNCSVQMLLV